MISIEKSSLIALTVILVSVAVGASPFIVKETSIDTTQVNFNASATVEANEAANLTDVGVNADPTMHFGEVPQNANFTKYIQVSVNERSEVQLSSTGNISQLLAFRDRQYIEGSDRISVQVSPAEQGYYEGELGLTVHRPGNAAGEFWVDTRERMHSFKPFKAP